MILPRENDQNPQAMTQIGAICTNLVNPIFSQHYNHQHQFGIIINYHDGGGSKKKDGEYGSLHQFDLSKRHPNLILYNFHIHLTNI